MAFSKIPSSAASSTIAVVNFKSSTYLPGWILDSPLTIEISPVLEIVKKSFSSTSTPSLTCAVGNSTVLSVLMMSANSALILLGSTLIPSGTGFIILIVTISLNS